MFVYVELTQNGICLVPKWAIIDLHLIQSFLVQPYKSLYIFPTKVFNTNSINFAVLYLLLLFPLTLLVELHCLDTFSLFVVLIALYFFCFDCVMRWLSTLFFRFICSVRLSHFLDYYGHFIYIYFSWWILWYIPYLHHVAHVSVLDADYPNISSSFGKYF